MGKILFFLRIDTTLLEMTNFFQFFWVKVVMIYYEKNSCFMRMDVSIQKKEIFPWFFFGKSWHDFPWGNASFFRIHVSIVRMNIFGGKLRRFNMNWHAEFDQNNLNKNKLCRNNLTLFTLNPEISFWSSKMDFSKMMFRSPYDRF